MFRARRAPADDRSWRGRIGPNPRRVAIRTCRWGVLFRVRHEAVRERSEVVASCRRP